MQSTPNAVTHPSSPMLHALAANWWLVLLRGIAGIVFGILACAAASAAAHPARHRHSSVAEAASRLRPGQYVWEARAGSRGPLFLVIDLRAQRAMLYRNGVPMAASTVSTGGKGRGTPTGVFTILQKEVMHRSRTYDDAPMSNTSTIAVRPGYTKAIKPAAIPEMPTIMSHHVGPVLARPVKTPISAHAPSTRA